MNTSKRIEISRSTLVSLKAELCRKEEEVKQAKAQAKFIRPTKSTSNKPNIWDKKNKGVDGREEKDFKEIAEENATLEKSRSILEAKAELYDRLSGSGASKIETLKASHIALVDFKQKQKQNKELERQKEVSSSSEEEGQYDSDEYDKPENSDDEWVDYTDCLGRTRRCLRRDITSLKEKDSKLAGTLGYIDTKPISPEHTPDLPKAPTPPLEQRLVSGDTQREALREKWDLEEQDLLRKDDVHYQDVLFDEVRSHGVSYYGFSRDEKKRREQQEQLAKVRLETRKKQAAAQDARARREQQLRARLRAAANRKRERQGLPPLPESDEERAPGDSEEEAEVERLLMGSRSVQREVIAEPEPLTREERPAPVVPRPWDLEKEKDKPVMSQHEWNELHRSERRSEFAPPSSSLYGFHSGGQFQLQSRPRTPSPEPEYVNKRLEPLKLHRKSTLKPISSSSSDEETVGPLPPMMKQFKKNRAAKRSKTTEYFSVAPATSSRSDEFMSTSSRSDEFIGPFPPVDTSVPPPAYPPPSYSVPPPSYSSPPPIPHQPLPSTPSSQKNTKRTWSDAPPLQEATSDRGRGTEIAPPSTMEYHFGGPKKTTWHSKPKDNDVKMSIAEGLAFLRKKAEEEKLRKSQF